MNRSVKSWLRRVYPPWWTMGVALLGYLMFESFRWLSTLVYDASEVALYIKDNRDGLIIICCGLYGAWRVVFFHPAFLHDYASWLRLTPWIYGKRLPKGPVHLVTQDFVFLAVAAALAVGSSDMVYFVLIAFVVAYLVFLTAALFFTDCRPYAYLLIFGLGVAVCLGEMPVLQAGWLVLLCLPAFVGLRRSLMNFPWEPECSGWWQITKTKRRQNEIRLGWPYEPLFLKTPKMRWALSDRVALSLLAGWWLYVVVGLFPPVERGQGAISLCALISSIAIGARVGIYCGSYWPPISIWGRLWTGRWIIPGYDRVLVAPLVAAAIGLATAATHSLIGPLGPLTYGLSLSTILLVLTLMRPSYRNWALTGSHRIVRINRNAQAKR